MIDLRKPLHRIPADYHGAIDFAELAEYGIRPDDVIDFSVNSNPFGPADSVAEAVKRAKLSRYPDKECLALRAAISGKMAVAEGQIMAGNGTAELLWLIAFGFLSPDDNVLIIGPTFGEYGRNARLMGACVTQWRAPAERNFALDSSAITEIEAELARLRPKLMHLCNPNNPTGQRVSNAVLARWSADFPHTLFIIDEAYQQFLKDGESAAGLELPNVIVLRSMTKDYSLAGLRLGYLVGPQKLVDGLRHCRIPWSVSEVAQAAGIAALQAQADYQTMWEALRTEAKHFKQGLADLGYRIIQSDMHYFLMEVENGAAFREHLLQKGMLVRKCDSFGLPNFVRISTQRPEENRRLLEQLAN